MKSNKKTNLLAGLFLGTMLVAVLALVIAVVEYLANTTLLAGTDEKISNYLSIIGVSFSVTFITTSLFGGLSDKSEKIYWRSYPESYLINTPLNFMVLSSISFWCLALQTFATVSRFLPEIIREAVFLASFLVGIGAIVILSYKFTVVFFSRKKLLVKSEKEFAKLACDNNRQKEFQRAVVGLFNNTLEVVEPGQIDFERVSENVYLLLRYDNHETCHLWLRKLIEEIGKKNPSILSQLALDLEEDEHFKNLADLIEAMAQNRDIEFTGDDVLTSIYATRISELMNRLGDGVLFGDEYSVDGDKYKEWEAVAKEYSIILMKIDVSKVQNCIFILNNLPTVPYELLQQPNCANTIYSVWDGILATIKRCVEIKDIFSYQMLQKKMFDFLISHPGYYVAEDPVQIGLIFEEQVGKTLHDKTAATIADMSEEQLGFMIDVIKDVSDKNKYLLWLDEMMAEGVIPDTVWNCSKVAPYSSSGSYYYLNDMRNSLILELCNRRRAVKNEYERLKNEPDKVKYAENIEVYRCDYYIDKMVKFLSETNKYEKDSYDKSLVIFIQTAINDVYLGEANSFIHIPFDPYADEDYEEEFIINRYVKIFDLLLDKKGGLKAMEEAVELTDGNGCSVNNYFRGSQDIVEQKRFEMLFFINHVCDTLENNKELHRRDIEHCAGILVEIMTNPCIGVRKDPEQNYKEVTRSIEIIKNNEICRSYAIDYINGMNEDYSLLDNLRQTASSNDGFGNKEYANELYDVADAFDESLMSLSGLLD